MIDSDEEEQKEDLNAIDADQETGGWQSIDFSYLQLLLSRFDSSRMVADQNVVEESKEENLAAVEFI